MKKVRFKFFGNHGFVMFISLVYAKPFDVYIQKIWYAIQLLFKVKFTNFKS